MRKSWQPKTPGCNCGTFVNPESTFFQPKASQTCRAVDVTNVLLSSPAQEAKAQQALIALESSTQAHDAKSRDFEQSLGVWQGLSDEVKNLTAEVDEAEVVMVAQRQAMEEDLRVRKQYLGKKQAARDEAEKVMMEKKAEAEAAGQLREQHEAEREQAEVAMHQARTALKAQQEILDEAIASLEVATAEAAKATSQKDHLDAIYQKQSQSLDMLMRVRREIGEFYKDMDALTVRMEKDADEQPNVPAPELLAKNRYLRACLESYNDVVIAYREVLTFDENLYGMIQPAVAEIKQNAWSAILLQCDPSEQMEIKAEASNDFAELQEKCGSGLWEAAGVHRLRFPAYRGVHEHVEEWWDKDLEEQSDEDVELQPTTTEAKAAESPTELSGKLDQLDNPESPESVQPTTKLPDLDHLEKPETPESVQPTTKLPDLDQLEKPETPEFVEPTTKLPDLDQLEKPETPEFVEPTTKLPDLDQLEKPETPEFVEPTTKLPDLDQLEKPETPESVEPTTKLPDLDQLEKPETPEFVEPTTKLPDLDQLEKPETPESVQPTTTEAKAAESPTELSGNLQNLDQLDNPESPESEDLEDSDSLSSEPKTAKMPLPTQDLD